MAGVGIDSDSDKHLNEPKVADEMVRAGHFTRGSTHDSNEDLKPCVNRWNSCIASDQGSCKVTSNLMKTYEELQRENEAMCRMIVDVRREEKFAHREQELGRREAELMARELAALKMTNHTGANRSPNRRNDGTKNH
jgi:hypothetical protein